MNKFVLLTVCQLMLFGVFKAQAEVSVGAAPQGDPQKVAEKIIKKNFPKCKHVTKAKRLPDGSISATCGKTNYRVFTMYSAEKGQMLELALDCNAAKSLGISCY